MNRRRLPLREISNSIMRYAFMLIMLLFALVPIFWLILTSLKTRQDIYGAVFFFKPQFESYRRIFTSEGTKILTSIINSIKVASINVAVVISVGCLTAYALSRLRFEGRKAVLVGILASRLMPPVVVVLPIFLFVSSIHQFDKIFTLGFLHSVFNLPICIWILKSYFDSIPIELEEAVLIDGGTRFTCAIHIFLPLARAGIATTTLFAFVFSWNEFFYALVFTKRLAVTAPIVLADSTFGEATIYWSDMAALATIIMIPAIILAFIGQRYFIKGLTYGASK